MKASDLPVGPCRRRELPRLRELLNQVFITERGAGGDIFEFAPLLYSEQNVENLRVVRRGRAIVGHAGILPRRIRWRGQVLHAGLIGGVCCREDLRGQGIGTLAMQDVARRMAQLQLDFGVLWTGSPGFYRRLGWRHGGGISIMRIAEAAGEGAVQREIIPLSDSPLGPADCHALHAGAGRDEVLRTPEETELLLSTGTRDALLALRGGRLVGYAAHDGSTVREIEGDADTCVALLSHAAALGHRLCVFPLNDPRLPAIAQALPVDIQRGPLGMILIVGREGLVAKIAEEAGSSPDDLGIGSDVDTEVLAARLFGSPDDEPTDRPLPMHLHIDYLDHV